MVSNQISFGRKGFKYFIDYKDAKKLFLYVHFSNKSVHIEDTFMKLNIYIYIYIYISLKDDELLEKYN